MVILLKIGMNKGKKEKIEAAKIGRHKRENEEI